MHKIKRKTIAIAAVLLLFYLFMVVVISRNLSNPEQLYGAVASAYGTYGYAIVFLVALLESLFLIGLFVPGTAVVMFGATLAAKGVLSFPLIIFFASLGFSLGSITNYWIGRLGWHEMFLQSSFIKRLPADIGVYKKKLPYIVLCYFSTGFGAVLSTLAGTIPLPFKRFAVTVICIHTFWTTFLGMIAFVFGVLFANIFLSFGGFLLLVAVIGVGVRWYVKKKK